MFNIYSLNLYPTYSSVILAFHSLFCFLLCVENKIAMLSDFNMRKLTFGQQICLYYNWIMKSSPFHCYKTIVAPLILEMALLSSCPRSALAFSIEGI